jgi:hypothetical protein
MRRANRTARLRLTTPASPLPSHADPKWPHTPTAAAAAVTAAPSPYSASSAYSYSYAYSNTPPTKGSQQPRRDRERAVPPAPLVLAPIMQEVEEEQDDNDAVRAHYLYMPPASPVPGDLLARRATRGTSPDRGGAGGLSAATGPLARAWSFSYAFTWRGHRRRVAVQAPKWWPRRGGGAAVGGAAGRRRRRREEVWSAAGRDFGRAIGPAMVVWVVLLWLY